MGNRKQINKMLYFTLIMVGTRLFQTSGFDLKCTNDYDKLMFCQLYVSNCTQFNMTLNASEMRRTKECAFRTCDGGCCCEINMIDDQNENLLFKYNTFLSQLYEDKQSVHSQTVDIYETIKPHTPTIINYEKVNAMYLITWKTNAKRSILEDLSANVIYYKKGALPVVSKDLHPNTVKDLNTFEIPSHKLESNTTYVVTVKTKRFNISSDSSEEMEFTTEKDSFPIAVLLVLGLCGLAVALSAGLFAFLIKIKGQLWDKVAKVEKPKLLDVKPNKEVILTPELLSVHSLSVEPLVPKDLTLSKECLSESSGGSGTSGLCSASSFLDYANTEPIDMEECIVEALRHAFPMFAPDTDMPGSRDLNQNCAIAVDGMQSSPFSYDNDSYFMTQSPEATDDTSRQVCSDSGYHSSEICPMQDFIFPISTPNIETDMSYQPSSQSNASVLPVHNYKEPHNVQTDQNTESSLWQTGLDHFLQSSDIDHFHEGFLQVSNEIIVDSGYHCV